MRDRISWALFVIGLGLTMAATGIAQCATQWQPGPVGSLGVADPRAHVLWDRDGSGPLSPVLVAGGTFTTAGGVAAANVAQRDLVTGAWSALGSGANGAVHALAVLPGGLAGGLAVGGAFTTAGGVAASHVARWDGAAWSALGNGLPGVVHALAVLPNGRLLAGGLFAPGVVAAAWDGAAWSPLPVPPLAGVHTVITLRVLANGDVLAGTTGPVAAVLRWDGAAWTVLGTPLAPPNPTTQPAIRALAVWANGDPIVGGTFSVGAANGNHYLARWDGTTWWPLAGALAGVVHTLGTLPNGYLVVGGSFTAGGVAAPPVHMWHIAFGPLGSGLAGRATSCVPLPNGDLLFGGTFVLGGATTLVRWSPPLGSWSSLDQVGPVPQAVEVIAPAPDGGYLVAAQLWQPNFHPYVAWSAGSSLSPLAPLGSSGQVRALLVEPNGDVIAGGAWQAAANGSVARWNGFAWSAIGGGFGLVNALLRSANGELIAGGMFLGSTLPHIARWDGTAWSALGSGIGGVGSPSPHVNALARLPNGDVVAGGTFTTAGGNAIAGIARWDGVAWSPLGAGISGAVYALAVLPNGDLCAGGGFTTVGVPATNIARWNGTNWSPIGGGVNAGVRALAVAPNGDLFAGGDFTMAGGAMAHYVARWDGVAWTAPAVWFTPLAGGAYVRSLAVLTNGELAVGGSFQMVDGVVSPHVVRLTTTCPASAVAAGAGCAGAGGADVLTATSLPWAGGTFTGTATGLPANAIAAVIFGFAPAAIPLASVLAQGLPGCTLLATPDVVTAALPVAGAVPTSLVIPKSPALAGRTLHHQVATLELDAAGALAAVTSTNALQLTIGWF